MRHSILKTHFLDTVRVLKESVFLVFLKGLTSVYPSVCVWKEVLESQWEVSFMMFREWRRLYTR